VRLAAPNVLVMLAQASVGLIEIYFIGKLGTDSLAGVTLVFPVVMLMQMMSAGAMGGGISSAIARALGGGRRADADALVLHALVIALAFGFAFTVALLAGAPWLYAAMGGAAHRRRNRLLPQQSLQPSRGRPLQHPSPSIPYAQWRMRLRRSKSR
jgi:Na+-driven multidrug efflux pump